MSIATQVAIERDEIFEKNIQGCLILKAPIPYYHAIFPDINT